MALIASGSAAYAERGSAAKIAARTIAPTKRQNGARQNTDMQRPRAWRRSGGDHLLMREQALGDLHGVQRCAFQELIAGDEHRNRPTGRIAQILADAADEYRVLAGGVFGHREIVRRNVVDDLNAGRGRENLAHDS